MSGSDTWASQSKVVKAPAQVQHRWHNHVSKISIDGVALHLSKWQHFGHNLKIVISPTMHALFTFVGNIFIELNYPSRSPDSFNV